MVVRSSTEAVEKLNHEASLGINSLHTNNMEISGINV